MNGSDWMAKDEKKPDLWMAGQDLIRKMDNLFYHGPQKNLLNSIDSFFQQSAFNRIPVNMYETDTDWFIEVELPGLRKEDIQLDIVGNHLHVSTHGEEATEVNNDETHQYYRQQRYHHRERVIPLPYPADMRSIKATYNNGILIVKGPKPKQQRAQLKIE